MNERIYTIYMNNYDNNNNKQIPIKIIMIIIYKSTILLCYLVSC